MKFVVTRTSNKQEKPCNEAEPYEVINVDIRTLKTPEEFDKQHAYREGKWLDKGTNHRIIDGCIARDIGTVKCWAVELNSLEDLIAFQKKYGDLVIQTSFNNPEVLELEIYDDYRE